MTEKIDFKRTLASYRAPRGRFEIIEVPERRYLMIGGHGDPNSAVAADAIAALYPVAYALKFTSARELGRDYVVPPLEALWWADDMSTFTSARDKSQWDWTMMMLVPEWLDEQRVTAAIAAASAKKDAAVRIPDVHLEALTEGRCVQTLHLGSYDDETGTLAELHERFIPGQGLRMTGRHHEVYLGDPRRTAPEKLRTILRQPVAPVETAEPVDPAGAATRR